LLPEIVRGGGAVRDQHEVVGARAAALGPRIVQERRKHAEDDDCPDVRERHGRTLDGRRQAAPRIGQHGVADECRRGTGERQPGCERERRSGAGVVQLWQEPRDPPRRQQGADRVVGPAGPIGQAASDERPPRAEERNGTEAGISCEPITRLITGNDKRPDAERDAQSRDSEGDRAALHGSHRRTGAANRQSGSALTPGAASPGSA
jgi:hypothetical protein